MYRHVSHPAVEVPDCDELLFDCVVVDAEVLRWFLWAALAPSFGL
jgi:hypothetical protein